MIWLLVYSLLSEACVLSGSECPRSHWKTYNIPQTKLDFSEKKYVEKTVGIWEIEREGMFWALLTLIHLQSAQPCFSYGYGCTSRVLRKVGR